jgi:hypothetical protein
MDPGAYLVDSDDSTLLPLTPYVGGNGELGDPVISINLPRLGIPNPPTDPGDPGGGGTDPANDFRNEPLLDPGPGVIVAGLYNSVSGLNLSNLGTLWGKGFYLTRVYSGSGPVLDGISAAQTHLNNGIVPVISINWNKELKTKLTGSNNVNGTGKNFWKFMADGGFDGASGNGMVTISTPSVGSVPGLRAVARAIKALNKGGCPTNTVVITPFHEMENVGESGWGSGVSSSEGFNSTIYGNFRDAWAQMQDIFDDEGVTNVLWGFCGATGTGHWGSSLTDTGSTGFYPGHARVDWMMCDPYNKAGQQNCAGGRPSVGYNNSWRPFGLTGDRGDGSTGSTINGNSQMSWWWGRFKMGGKPTLAEVTGSEGVYKPMWLGETGTGEYQANDQSNPAKQADKWWDDMITWLSGTGTIPGVDTPIRGYIYFHNQYNNVTCTGSHRRAGFTGRGSNAVFADIEVLG